ncbi:hypothetical protein D3C81_2246270 [compost metagenome]
MTIGSWLRSSMARPYRVVALGVVEPRTFALIGVRDRPRRFIPTKRGLFSFCPTL